MPESIKEQLEQLESVGRVSVRSQRPVHSGFGFESIERDPSATAPRASDGVAESLDDAWSRLKQRIKPE